MINENKRQVIDLNTDLVEVQPKYVYAIIPAEYICVYHRILAMLADYGVDMLKDCKATCKDRNSGVIECFNMFNAAVAARQLGDETNPDDYYTKLAATLIKFIKAKINQIYKGKDNSTSFVFPVDENGEIKAFVSCEDEPKFMINSKDMDLYNHKFNKEFDEHFYFGEEDYGIEDDDSEEPKYGPKPEHTLDATIKGFFEKINGVPRACADVEVRYDGSVVRVGSSQITYYFDGEPVVRFNNVVNIVPGKHVFTAVVKYKGITDVTSCEVSL